MSGLNDDFFQQFTPDNQLLKPKKSKKRKLAELRKEHLNVQLSEEFMKSHIGGSYTIPKNPSLTLYFSPS